MAKTLKLELPPKLVGVFSGEARYRGAYGGRGSAKTRTFAKMAAVFAARAAAEGRTGVIVCGREFQNSLDDSSMAEVKAAIKSDKWLSSCFDVGERYIRTLDGRVSFTFLGLRRNLDSIKSLANILLCWIDEAEPVPESAWRVLIPTVREAESEIWVTWNPRWKNSATNKRFRLNPPDGAKIVEMNWLDNPYFPAVLEAERLADKKHRPDSYAHVWEGDYETVTEGAYYASQLAEAKAAGRICKLAPDPLLPLRSYHDIGGSGRNADSYAIWVCQFVDRELRFYASYEAQGQTLKYHVRWLRDWAEAHGFDRVDVILPHDGVSEGQGVTGRQYKDHWAAASDADFVFDVRVVANQGRGAAMMRIEAARTLFGQMWFDGLGCEHGLEALAHYHEKIDDKRELGLGPLHDWSSHSADAFGMAAIDYEIPAKKRKRIKRERNPWAA